MTDIETDKNSGYYSEETNQHFLFKVDPAHLLVTHPDSDMFLCKLFGMKNLIFPVFAK